LDGAIPVGFGVGSKGKNYRKSGSFYRYDQAKQTLEAKAKAGVSGKPKI
jgi:hypothetical protein